MKKDLLYGLAAAVTGTMMLASCGSHAKHAESICLPDSVLVGVELPTIDGTLSEYGTIVPLPYTLNLTDSLLSLDITFSVNGGAKIDYVQKPVLYGDSLYLQPTDSTGQAIPGFNIDITPASLDSLTKLLAANKPDTLVITLVEAVPSTVESRDSLALVARNLQLVGNVALVIDTSKIDAALDAYEKQAKIYSSMNFNYGDTWDPVRWPLLQKHTDSLYEAERNAKVFEPFMSDEQKARLKKIDGSYQMIYWD